MSEDNVFPFLGASRNRRRSRVKTHDPDIDPNDRHQTRAGLDHYFVLRDALGPTIAGGLAGVGKVGISRWSPSIEEEQRIAMATSVWVTVSRADDDDTARGWFVGLNPWLGGESPVDALISGRLQDVRAAATAFEQDTWSG